MRHILSTALVASIVGALAGASVSALAQPPEPSEAGKAALVPAGLNADTVDGKHAVSATSNRSKRRRKLVATNKAGLLPSNIVRHKWAGLRGVPAPFADGKISWNEIQEVPIAIYQDEGIRAAYLNYVRGDEVRIPPGETRFANVLCPYGETVEGGYRAVPAAGTIHVTTSQPQFRSAGWQIEAWNDGNFDALVRAWVVCLSTTPSAALQVINQ